MHARVCVCVKARMCMQEDDLRKGCSAVLSKNFALRGSVIHALIDSKKETTCTVIRTYGDAISPIKRSYITFQPLQKWNIYYLMKTKFVESNEASAIIIFLNTVLKHSFIG